MTRSVLSFDLADESAALRQEAGWRHAGHSAKTLAKHPDSAIVLVAMKQGTRMMEHHAGGAISIQVITGRLQLRVGAKVLEVAAGHLLVLDRAVAHDVEALADSDFVLSVCNERKPGAR